MSISYNDFNSSSTVFTYFVSDSSQMASKNRVMINLDFESIELQICHRKLLVERNNYWRFSPSQLTCIESYLSNNKNTLIEFKSHIEHFLSISEAKSSISGVFNPTPTQIQS